MFPCTPDRDHLLQGRQVASSSQPVIAEKRYIAATLGGGSHFRGKDGSGGDGNGRPFLYQVRHFHSPTAIISAGDDDGVLSSQPHHMGIQKS